MGGKPRPERCLHRLCRGVLETTTPRVSVWQAGELVGHVCGHHPLKALLMDGRFRVTFVPMPAAPAAGGDDE